MLQIDDKANCCGCTACASICSVGAINMVSDEQGFIYPQIDSHKCVDCGLCEKVCVFNRVIDVTQLDKYPLVYAARHISEMEVEMSRSGATFVALSNAVLSDNGVIFGASLTRDLRVVHKRAINSVERDLFRGSKYVQSDLTGIFHQVKDDLMKGNKVLFSGTPCQVAGLKSYLSLRRIDLTNLILVDVICHGVPSPKYWKDYLSYIEKKEGDKIKRVDFRDKTKYGWSSHVESFVFASGQKKSYSHKFYHDIMLRRSCLKCPYTKIKRVSDITLGDFWGWERLGITMNDDNKGLNLVLINSAKGELLFRDIRDKLIYYQTQISKCLQPNLLNPTNKHPMKDYFERDYVVKGFEYVGKMYNDLGWRFKWRRIKRYIREHLL